MEICGMHIQGTKPPFHHIPKMLYWKNSIFVRKNYKFIKLNSK